MRVNLTPGEVLQGAYVGVMRCAKKLAVNRRDSNGLDPSHSAWQIDIEGALAELAVSKALNIYWNGALTFRACDVGGWQVRSSTRENACLILHDSDASEDRFVLVTGAMGSYLIRGWITGRKGKVPQYWAEKVAGRPAYFVPQCDLLPIAEERRAA